MRPATLLFLAIAIVAGVAALVLANKYLSNAGNSNADTFEIYLAKAPVESGQQVTEQMIEKARYPKSAAKDEKLMADFITNPKDIAGLFASKDYAAGDPIRKSSLSKTGGLGGEILPGMRAATVKVDTAGALAGFLRRGSIVDITWLRRNRGADSSLYTILQGLKVLAVNDKMSNVGKTDSQGSVVETVTLLVSQVQSEMLAYAEKEGVIKLIMRNGEDKDFSQTKGITSVADLATLGKKIEETSEETGEAEKGNKQKIDELLAQKIEENNKSLEAKFKQISDMLTQTKDEQAKVGEVAKNAEKAAKTALETKTQPPVTLVPTVAQSTPPKTDAAKTPDEPIAPKKQKFLVIRNEAGEELMKVKVKDEKMVNGALSDFVVEEEVAEGWESSSEPSKANSEKSPPPAKPSKSGKSK